MALVNVNFTRVLGDKELLYLQRIFGSAFATAVKKNHAQQMESQP